MAFVPIRRPRLSQPSCGEIDWANPISKKILDAWLPQSLTVRSVLGRKPTYVASGGISITVGKFGIGASGTNGSVRYDVGSFGQSGTYAFLTIATFNRYSNTCSVVRRDGAFVPVQVANNNVRSVGWSPVALIDNYFSSPSGVNGAVLLSNRKSQSTCDLWKNGAKVLTDSGFSGYGSTSNPLCFLATEGNAEIFTGADGYFYGGIAFKESLTDIEAISMQANPWQVFL